MDCSPPGSPVHGIPQAKILEWGAISFYRDSSWPRDRNQASCGAGGLFTTLATREAPKLKGQEREVVYIDLANSYNGIGNMICS